MLPLVSRATSEVLNLVPDSLREASFALGVASGGRSLFVVLPTTLGGDPDRRDARGRPRRRRDRAAPVHDLDLPEPVVDGPEPRDGSLPFTDLRLLGVAGPGPATSQAWAAAFILIMFVLVRSLTARYLLARRERKLTGR